MLNFSLRSRTLIVTVTGDVDQHNAGSIRDGIDLKISHENVKRLIFDFSNLDFMDSSGIGIIIGRYKLMNALGGTVAIVAVKPTLQKLLDLSGIKKIVPVFGSLQEAISTKGGVNNEQ